MPPSMPMPLGNGTSVVVRDPSSPWRGACILLPPGRAFPRVNLFHLLANSLVAASVKTFEIPAPDTPESSWDADLQQRLEATTELVNSSRFAEHRHCFTMLGFSRGGQVALRYVQPGHSPQPKTLVLCSTVVEQPTVIDSSVSAIRLVYGARDGIAYVSADRSSTEIILPRDYAASSMQRLITVRSQQVTSEILSGRGHFLVTDGQEDAPLVTSLTAQLLP